VTAAVSPSTQYLSIRYTERLADAGIELSVGAGAMRTTALAETVIGGSLAGVLSGADDVAREAVPWLSAGHGVAA
jgi:hypothetical protein